MNLDTSVGNLDVADAEFAAILTSITIYGTITVIGFVAVTLFLAVQIIGRKVFDEFPFFTIVWYLTLINLLHIVTQAFFIFPCMLINMPETGPWAIWQTIGNILIDYTDQTIMYFTFLMALNRFAVFVWKQLQEIFSTYHVKKVIWLTILFVIPICTYRFLFGTKKRFNKKTLNFDDIFLTQSDDLLINIISASLYCLPLINLVFYLIIYINLRKQRTRSMYQKGDNDIALLYQALAISVFLELTRMVSVTAPMLKTDTWVRWVLNISRSVCSILNHSINPILFLTTNQTVKGVLRQILPKSCLRFISGSSLSTIVAVESQSSEKNDRATTPVQTTPVQIVMTI